MCNAVLNTNQFRITSIITTGFTNSTIPATSAPNQISGVVESVRNSAVIVSITGEYYKGGIKTDKKLLNTSTVGTTEITAHDPTNNTTTNEVQIRKCTMISNPVQPSYGK
ncbi:MULTISPECIES: hypothetical protein [Chryseobacterium]|uniref:hypothetical protein n=1 Tax=Chryseobacterium TaxID=59732 RepID=UPI00195A48A4|nr:MULTISPECIES: hypothetical protein [Chryseobacterium]MBM7420163.1 hypothetical protein [Chryseobacterium sp. JUb44]MDH6210102.1 hypothetical protein [Chryseobacterium sp. BIGb0186]WSO08829.1 hypothetical protein VUJ64_13445 [Chryseobacterium scophthalmum]